MIEPSNEVVSNKVEPSRARNVVEPVIENVVEETKPPLVALASDELTLTNPNGGSRRLSFGAEKAATIASASKTLGSPMEQSTNTECGAGPLDYALYRDGMTLFFKDGKFAGWDLDGSENPRFVTASGVTIGLKEGELALLGDLRIKNTSIGREFRIGKLAGILGREGRVSNVWAGVTCIAR